jgi:hypothetical protein
MSARLRRRLISLYRPKGVSAGAPEKCARGEERGRVSAFVRRRQFDEPQVALPAFGLLRFPSARLLPGSSALGALNDPSALVLMPWSSARPALARFASAIPIGDTAPTEATIRRAPIPAAHRLLGPSACLTQ